MIIQAAILDFLGGYTDPNEGSGAKIGEIGQNFLLHGNYDWPKSI